MYEPMPSRPRTPPSRAWPLALALAASACALPSGELSRADPSPPRSDPCAPPATSSATATACRPDGAAPPPLARGARAARPSAEPAAPSRASPLFPHPLDPVPPLYAPPPPPPPRTALDVSAPRPADPMPALRERLFGPTDPLRRIDPVTGRDPLGRVERGAGISPFTRR